MASLESPQHEVNIAAVNQDHNGTVRDVQPVSSENHLVLVESPSQALPRHHSRLFYSFILSLAVAAGAILAQTMAFTSWSFSSTPTINALDYTSRTQYVLSTSPLIDGHNDLPYLIRSELKNQIYPERFTFHQGLLSHTDMRKMRQGQMGGQFWSVYMPCAEDPSLAIDDPTV